MHWCRKGNALGLAALAAAAWFALPQPVRAQGQLAAGLQSPFWLPPNSNSQANLAQANLAQANLAQANLALQMQMAVSDLVALENLLQTLLNAVDGGTTTGSNGQLQGSSPSTTNGSAAALGGGGLGQGLRRFGQQSGLQGGGVMAAAFMGQGALGSGLGQLAPNINITNIGSIQVSITNNFGNRTPSSSTSSGNPSGANGNQTCSTANGPGSSNSGNNGTVTPQSRHLASSSPKSNANGTQTGGTTSTSPTSTHSAHGTKTTGVASIYRGPLSGTGSSTTTGANATSTHGSGNHAVGVASIYRGSGQGGGTSVSHHGGYAMHPALADQAFMHSMATAGFGMHAGGMASFGGYHPMMMGHASAAHPLMMSHGFRHH